MELERNAKQSKGSKVKTALLGVGCIGSSILLGAVVTNWSVIWTALQGRWLDVGKGGIIGFSTLPIMIFFGILIQDGKINGKPLANTLTKIRKGNKGRRLIPIIVGMVMLLAIVGTIAIKNKPSTSEITLEKLANKKNSAIGQLNNIYRVNTKYSAEDGSYFGFNVQNAKYFPEFTSNTGDELEGVVVLKVVHPLENTREFVEKAAHFAAYNSYGKEVKTGDIYTQTSADGLTEIIIDVENQCDFILIGPTDKITTQHSTVLFELDTTLDINLIHATLDGVYDDDAIKNVEVSDGVLNVEIYSRAEEHYIDKKTTKGDPIDIEKMDKEIQWGLMVSYSESIVDLIGKDIQALEIKVYSIKDELKSSAILETAKITGNEYGRFWEGTYIDEVLVLGPYFD